jgi:long-chain acyl-CoA synthetase
MRGYWNKQEETAASMIDGALRTGDVGYLDDDGYLFLVDRIKDVIIAGGYNIYPRVLEEALYQHPAVQDAVVIGVADKYRGQAPKAFVTLKPGTHSDPATLLAFLKGYVSKIEMPKEIEIRDELPKTLIGKLSKKELIAEEEAKRQ